MFHTESELKSLHLREAGSYLGRDIDSTKQVDPTALSFDANARVGHELRHEGPHFAFAKQSISFARIVDTYVFLYLKRQFS